MSHGVSGSLQSICWGSSAFGLTFTVILSISFYQVCSKRTRSYPYIQTVCVVSLIHPLQGMVLVIS